MKKAIEFLRGKGITVTDEGVLLSLLPDGIAGISVIDQLEYFTENEEFYYTVISGKLVRQYL